VRNPQRLSRPEVRCRRSLPPHADVLSDLNAKDDLRIKAYPAREHGGGMIWAYMGPPERVAKLPAMKVVLVPASHRYVTKKWQDCNWVQAMEGSIDTAHFSFDHLTFDKAEDEELDIQRHLASPMSRMNFDRCAGSRRSPPRHRG